jgi:hypothetical protein
MKNHGNVITDNVSPSAWKVLLTRLGLSKLLRKSTTTVEPGKELVLVSTGRHHAPEGRKVGTFTFGGIRAELSFEWLTQKRRRFTGKVLYNGLTSKIYAELRRGDLSWTQNPGVGRHAYVEAAPLPSEVDEPTLQLAAAR